MEAALAATHGDLILPPTATTGGGTEQSSGAA